MPPKLRELMGKLEKAGFIDRGGKGSHHNFLHPSGIALTLSGHPGADAKPYQIRLVAKKLEELADETE